MEATSPNTPETQQQETKWYVLRVVSGKERKVKEYLDKEITRGGWGEIVKQVFLPVEKVYKVQNGKKVMRERNYYPGYVMIEIEEGNETPVLQGGLYIEVEDVEAWYEKALKKNIKIIQPLSHRSYGHHSFKFEDPNGLSIGLFRYLSNE